MGHGYGAGLRQNGALSAEAGERGPGGFAFRVLLALADGNKTLAQLRQEEGELLAVQERAGWNFQPPQGESRRSQLARCRQALLEAAGRCPGESILVVTHAGVIKCLANGLSGSGPLAADEIGTHAYRLYWATAAAGRLTLDGRNALALP